MIMNIGAWFLAGRWIFSFGYLFGTLIGVPQLRGLGFGLTIMPIIFILEHIFCKEACLSNLSLSLNL